MTAPALVLLAEGSSEPRVVEVIHKLRKQMQLQRQELSVHLAFLEHCPPSGPQVVNTLVARGVQEIVFAPLALSHAVDVGEDAEKMLTAVRKNHPKLNVTLAHPIGPATELLNVLDLRLRNALSACHALELDALVLCTPDSGDLRGSALLARRARQWGSHHKLPVAVACADGSGTSVTSAIASLHEQGRRAIAVGSLFLTADEHYAAATEQALACGAVTVSAPLGADEHIVDLIMARYAFAAMDMLDDVPADERLGSDVMTTSNTQLIAM